MNAYLSKTYREMSEWQHQALSWLPTKQRIGLLQPPCLVPGSRCIRTARALVIVVELAVDELWHKKALTVLHEEDPLISRKCYALALHSIREAMRLLVNMDRMQRLELLEKELLKKASTECPAVGTKDVQRELAVHVGEGITALLLARR